MKKIHIIIAFSIAIIASFLVACHTNIIDDTDIKGTNSINLLTDEAIQFIDSEYSNDSTVVFKYDTPDYVLPKIGSIIVVPMIEKLPNGLLGKVVAIERDGNIKIITEQVSLDEAFENLSIDTEIDLLESFEGVFDEEGKPIEYEFVDSLFSDKPTNKALNTRTGEFYLEEHIVKFPIKLYKKTSGSVGVEVVGTAYMGFKSAKLDIDVVNFKTHYINFETQPTVGLKFSSVVSAKNDAKLSGRIGQLRFRPKVIIPIGPAPVPVIIPITLYLDGECGVKGEAQATLSYKSEFSPKWQVELKNGVWLCKDNSQKVLEKKSPWSLINGEFSVNGEIYSTTKFGVLVGLYSATTGIGVNVCPTYSLSANAKISSDLLKINPKVENEIALNSEVYCVAKLFGKQLGKYSFILPKFVFWSEKMYLLPQFENFEAYGNSTLGEISYQIDQHYFLEGFGVKIGTCVFENDKKSIYNSYYPSPTSTNNKGYSFYNQSVLGLNSGTTYYASPLVKLPFEDWTLYGDMYEFTTEANYRLGFRCSSQSYDVISFDFSLNNNTGNVIDYTTDANDYGGEPMRVHITAQYNATTKMLDGVFDFFFYDTPSQQRKDGFSVSLSSDDSGYVNCSKVVDNGGCYAALRIYKQNSRTAAAKYYNKALMDDDCNIGIFNKYYKK